MNLTDKKEYITENEEKHATESLMMAVDAKSETLKGFIESFIDFQFEEVDMYKNEQYTKEVVDLLYNTPDAQAYRIKYFGADRHKIYTKYQELIKPPKPVKKKKQVVEEDSTKLFDSFWIKKQMLEKMSDKELADTILLGEIARAKLENTEYMILYNSSTPKQCKDILKSKCQEYNIKIGVKTMKNSSKLAIVMVNKI